MLDAWGKNEHQFDLRVFFRKRVGSTQPPTSYFIAYFAVSCGQLDLVDFRSPRQNLCSKKTLTRPQPDLGKHKVVLWTFFEASNGICIICIVVVRARMKCNDNNNDNQ